jgi:hypothetical protein
MRTATPRLVDVPVIWTRCVWVALFPRRGLAVVRAGVAVRAGARRPWPVPGAHRVRGITMGVSPRLACLRSHDRRRAYRRQGARAPAHAAPTRPPARPSAISQAPPLPKNKPSAKVRQSPSLRRLPVAQRQARGGPSRPCHDPAHGNRSFRERRRREDPVDRGVARRGEHHRGHRPRPRRAWR